MRWKRLKCGAARILSHILDAIRPFLAGQAFEPDVIREMSLALETVCAKLALKLTDDPARRLVASKIIELAQRGVRDAATLSAMTLKELSPLADE